MEKYRDNQSSAGREDQLPTGKTPAKTAAVVLASLFSVLYLLNPTAGFIEFIPDNIPFLGNLDEAGAVILLLACFRYFGVDLTRWLSAIRGATERSSGGSPDAPDYYSGGTTSRPEKNVTPRDAGV